MRARAASSRAATEFMVYPVSSRYIIANIVEPISFNRGLLRKNYCATIQKITADFAMTDHSKGSADIAGDASSWNNITGIRRGPVYPNTASSVSPRESYLA
jgi:hypothetical protein